MGCRLLHDPFLLMMKEQENISMNLNIDGERISLTVPFSSQEQIREIEKEINGLCKNLRKRYKTSDRTLMAMAAYQYAFYYTELKTRYEEALRRANECLEILGEAPEGESE